MLPNPSLRKKLRSPGHDNFPNPKTTITCTNVPESLFEANAATKHFCKFGKVHRIRLFPKRQACMIEYDQPSSVERAVLNAGAYDGFMFDVTRTKARVRKRSKREDDPDWVPDPDVAQELSMMRGAPTYNTRKNSMETEPNKLDNDSPTKVLKRVIKQTVKKMPVRQPMPARQSVPALPPPVSGIESPVIVTTQTTLSTSEAAAELHQLRSKVSLSADEQWRTLDARDRILRSWGGAGSRVKVGGATIGTCQDMCPEKELLHRQAEHQVMLLETDSDGFLEPRRAVKQYSRSSADQEIPMCYELRPASVLLRTCSYLLHEIADTPRQISLADWFHFMWDRFRGIRKDITQQALCCAESICLVEMCARFHAHCAARLADLEHTQFDQKLNTDNLTKCLQTLKHMYADVISEQKPREAEFRGYIALLNLGDANFWWEIKQLPENIQKSEPITFAIKVFNALDNNNYVRFFRLVQENANYLQACILLRYFNDVRARALARIVKAYAPRGGSRFPASDLVNALAFESVDNMKSFINHYGLRFAKADDYELSVILDRNQFIEDSDPYPTARALQLIETKRQSTVGQLIAGGQLPKADYFEHSMHKSFTSDGRLKETALVAEEQEFNTTNDSNKNVQALKDEIHRLAQGGRSLAETSNEPRTLFVKPDVKSVSPRPKAIAPPVNKPQFTFKPAITVAPKDIIDNSPEKTFVTDNVFSFSKPQVTEKDAKSLFTLPAAKTSAVFGKSVVTESKGLFGRTTNDTKVTFQNTQNVFGTKPSENIRQENPTSVFGQKSAVSMSKKPDIPKSIFTQKPTDGLFSKPDIPKPMFTQQPKIGTDNLFTTPNLPKSVFGQRSTDNSATKPEIQQSVFGQKPTGNLFSKPELPKSVFGQAVVETKHESDKTLFGMKPSSNSTVNEMTISTKNIFASSKDSLFMSKPDNNSQFGNTNSIFAKESSQESNTFSKPVQAVSENKLSSSIFAKPATEEPNQGGNIFAKLGQSSEGTKSSIFTKPVTNNGDKAATIFGSAKLPVAKNIFTKPEIGEQNTPSAFVNNGDVPANDLSPGTFFKSAINPPNGTDAKGYSIFQSKNKAQTVADSIFNSVNAATFAKDAVYDFQSTENDEQNQVAMQRLREEKMRQEEAIQLRENLRKEEERRQAEELRQAELRKQEEERRKAEEKRKHEELKLLEEKCRLEEERKQKELKRKLEEERKAKLKRQSEEAERKFREAVDKESIQLVEQLITEINSETSRELLLDEQEIYRQILRLTGDMTEEIINELNNEICYSEMKAEVFLTQRIMRKWFDVWRKQFIRNVSRRKWLDDTPVWLSNRTPVEEALRLRRPIENASLKNMNAIHRGYKFSGELKQLPPPESYKLMEIIRSPLLKRMKQICYPYDKCFFWKVTLVSPGENQWLCRKINVDKWLIDAFNDQKKHEESETLIQVGKQSWNHLMDFAISVSLARRESMSVWGEAVEGTNGVLFYSTDKDENLLGTIKQILENKFPYQVIPVAVILPKKDDATHNDIQTLLGEYVNRKVISGYKIFVLDPKDINELLNSSTKSALKWMAKKFPEIPPLEIDYLKSICQRYLGNEIWCKFRIERDSRMREVLKDIQKLINCYNVAVDKLTDIITNEELFNYTSFPLELKPYLEQASPYPKPYEFIPSNARTSENVTTIRDIMKHLKLPNTLTAFRPLSAVNMQQQIRAYCNQIGWFENAEAVVCKVVAVLPSELSDLDMPSEDFKQYFAHYDLIDFLNIIIYEKINGLYNFDNRFAVYEKSVLQEYRNINWLYDVKSIAEMKHKAIACDDEVDGFIEAKRRKVALDSLEYLMLEDKDITMVAENIETAEANISKYSIVKCSEAVKQLEEEIEERKKISVEYEDMLRAALADV